MSKEMDRTVAEHVEMNRQDEHLTRLALIHLFGITWIEDVLEVTTDTVTLFEGLYFRRRVLRGPDEHINKMLPDPLMNDSDAHKIVERMKADGWYYQAGYCMSPYAPHAITEHCQFFRYVSAEPERGFSQGPGRRKNIVLAALKAKGVEVDA